ncbi:CactinC-cactus domain-containing protein [Aphelenchoides bicaudatus]|nr:CactinC-cactus domain-containing protein [Aphelenchoides bicaudatus]
MGMGGDEATFSVEEDLGQQKMLWTDKYRPQKPKYFNRVHTGFDWNKYNQTHYTGLQKSSKIFYPDLLDITKTPRFTLSECPNDPDFAILRFHAGPPYEDIAFKIVNREWEAHHKAGYKCQFSNSVFQLWFFFKRYRYRR